MDRKESSIFRQIQRKYEGLCPYGKEKVRQMATEDLKRIGVLSAVVIMLLLSWNLSFDEISIVYIAGTLLLAVDIIAEEVPEYRLRKIKKRFYMEYIRYLSKVKHLYIRERSIPNAVQDAAEEFSEEIRLHAMLLHQILSGYNRKELVRNYVLFTEYNQYLKMFLVQAYEASEKGDVYDAQEGSLFSENVEYLRAEVMEECYRREKRNYEFAGYIFVSLVPVFTMPLLKSWGLEFAPELEGFYRIGGKIIEILTLLMTWLIYRFITGMKEDKTTSRYCKWPILRRILDFFEKSVLFQEAEYEIRQFQTVIIMERKLSMITILELLEDMEIFSRLFRGVLRECINSYAAGSVKALKKMKFEGRKIHREFEAIAEGFLAVDGVGIAKAFAEVAKNREMLEKMTRLEAEIQIAQKKDRMELLSRIPMFLTVGMYFIVPFFISSMQGVFAVFDILEELRM